MSKKNKSATSTSEIRAALSGDEPPVGASPSITSAHAFLCGRAEPSVVASADAETFEALVSLLVDRGDVERLRALESLPHAPEVTRAARRGLHVLRTRGVAVAPADSRSAEWRVAAEPLPDARLGLDFMYDMQWLTLYRRDETGEGVAVIATIDGEGALRSMDAIRTSRGRYRELSLSLAPRDAFSTEIPADEAFRRLLEAAEAHARLGRPHLESMAVLKKLTPLGATPHETAPRHVSPAPPFDRDAFAKFAERPELRTWVPDDATIGAFVEAIKDAQTSLVAIDKRQIAAQIQTVVERTTATFFSADRRKTHARRFTDLAREFARREAPNAGDARDMATALSAVLGSDGVDVATHPYTLWFFGRFVPAIMAEHPARIARGAHMDDAGADRTAPAAGKIILP